MAATRVLGALAFGREGSNPFFETIVVIFLSFKTHTAIFMILISYQNISVLLYFIAGGR